MIDDTFCTNRFDLPIISVIAPDFNLKNQLVGFGYIPDRRQESYSQFLSFLKSYLTEVNCFVTDRSVAQIAALRKNYPNAFLIYCKIHIQRNVDSHFPHSEIPLHFNGLFNGTESEEEFFKYIHEKTKDFSQKQQRFIENLMAESNHWLPSHVNKLRHYGNVTTNRIEGFFGVLKPSLDHKINTLLHVANSIKSMAETAAMHIYQEKKLI
jgi:hypothetical protein